MEFNKKLQELRKKKGITQENLAKSLYVSRTAISKWESGRGYPSIDSLKSIADYFEISVDELLSNEELLSITKEKLTCHRDLIFGLLDVSVLSLFLLPLFGQKFNNVIEEVSLLNLSEISLYLLIFYYVLIISLVVTGILTLALQNYKNVFWQKIKSKISFFLNTLALILFIISQQPYVATFLLIFLIIKTLTLLKK